MKHGWRHALRVATEFWDESKYIALSVVMTVLLFGGYTWLELSK